MTRLVRPQPLRGFRDVLPADMILRNAVIDRVRAVYEAYGFVPLDSPVLESLETLLGAGGEDADKQIFTARAGDEPEVGMRFDLTVPFARMIAQYAGQELRLPLRRYHLGPVFRADDPHPEQGRFRQFTQFDVDIAGAATVAADAEIVAVMCAALAALGLRPAGPDPQQDEPGGYFLRVNNRRLVDAFLVGAGVSDPDQVRQVLRVLDKADKISPAQLAAELGEGRYDASGDRIRGVGLSPATAQDVLDFAAITGATRAAVLSAVAERLPSTEQAEQAVAQVQELLAQLQALEVPEGAARLDPSLARGLAYYTGTVYEGTMTGAGVGSVLGGGRYDGLVSRFSDEPVSAVGASLGVDRLIAGVRNLGLDLGVNELTAQVLVLVMPGVDPALATAAAHQLRRAGIAAELFVGAAAGKVGKQLAYANARGFAAAVMIGANEARDQSVTIKDLQAGRVARAEIEDNTQYRSAGSAGQLTVPRERLVESVRSIL